jgi:hypothetical protein
LALQVPGIASSPSEELLLLPRPGKHDVERHPTAAVNEGNHSCSSDEIRIAENDIESMFAHGVDVAGQSSMLEQGRHVDSRRSGEDFPR